MLVFTLFVSDKDSKERFVKEGVLLADIKPNIVLEIFFLTISNVDIDFESRDLKWRSYTNGDVLLTIKYVGLIGKKKFAAAAFDLEYEVFAIHVAALSIDSGDKIHPSKKAQIAYLKANETPMEVPSEYADFPNVFLPKLAAKLSKYIRINDYTIELVDD